MTAYLSYSFLILSLTLLKIHVAHFDLGLVEGEVKASLKSSLEQEIVASDRLKIVVGKSHPWFERKEIPVTELFTTAWVMRESGSGTQQSFEQALLSLGIEPTKSNVILILILSSGEMVKAVVENGVGAAAISELMVRKELKLGTLRAIRVIDDRDGSKGTIDIIRPFLKLKHRQRFQTRLSKAFEQTLIKNESLVVVNRE
ncbi:MAG TPA: LysR substrate-binding domain-containing protein [Coleofasciculaceae cyanobacterium]